MALWGNNDNVGSAGTVSLDYATRVVTGYDGVGTANDPTAFGAVGSAQTGDVIRFGDRTGTYYGDAVIVSIASTQSLTIGSTQGLSGAAIAGVEFQVSQLPKYTVLDESYSERLATSASAVVVTTGAATTAISVGSSSIPFNTVLDDGNAADVKVGDFVVNGGSDIEITSVGSATAAADITAAVGDSLVYIVAPTGTLNGYTIINNGVSIGVTGIGATTVALGATIGQEIVAGTGVTFYGQNLIGLALTVSSAVGNNGTIQFKRTVDGYDKYAYGISTTGVVDADNTAYEVAHSGWVGVQTYIDNSGNLRVKSEVLVAASGITTGNTPVYPPA